MPSATVEAFWQDFLNSLPPGSEISGEYQVWYFGDSQPLSLELAALVLEGKKTATAGLLWSYEAGREPTPIPGMYSVVTSFEGVPLCVVQTSAAEVVPYHQVSAEYAWLEGEGDRSLADWREGHWRFFTRECKALGREPSEDMPVVCERFRLVYP